jgi:hypothetical protein
MVSSSPAWDSTKMSQSASLSIGTVAFICPPRNRYRIPSGGQPGDVKGSSSEYSAYKILQMKSKAGLEICMNH